MVLPMQMLLDDQLMKVQAMNASPFVKPFRAETVEWEATLQFLQVRGRCDLVL
jgi:dynein heavy chain